MVISVYFIKSTTYISNNKFFIRNNYICNSCDKIRSYFLFVVHSLFKLPLFTIRALCLGNIIMHLIVLYYCLLL